MRRSALRQKPTKEMVIGVIPEGPIAFDGSDYRYSKGERLYLDKLSANFKALDLLTLVLVKGDNAYETCLHSAFQSDSLHVHELPRPKSKNLSVLGKAMHLLKILWFLFRRIPKVDVVYLFLPSYPGAMGWLVAKIFRKPHIVYGADDWVTASESMFKWPQYKETRFYRAYIKLNQFFEWAIVRTALFGVVAGGQLKSKYEAIGCDTYHTSPRMTLSREDMFERDLNDTKELFKVIHVGALIHDKAQHIMLDVFANVSKTYENMRLIIIGDGPLRLELTAQAESLGIAEQVSFVGYVEKEEILYDYLKQADAFLLTSVTEGFPRVLYEAMAHNVPIVTTDVGGIPYLLTDKQDALICPTGDNLALSQALGLLVENLDLRKKLTRNACKTMQLVFDRSDPNQIASILQKMI